MRHKGEDLVFVDSSTHMLKPSRSRSFLLRMNNKRVPVYVTLEEKSPLGVAPVQPKLGGTSTSVVFDRQKGLFSRKKDGRRTLTIPVQKDKASVSESMLELKDSDGRSYLLMARALPTTSLDGKKIVSLSVYEKNADESK